LGEGGAAQLRRVRVLFSFLFRIVPSPGANFVHATLSQKERVGGVRFLIEVTIKAVTPLKNGVQIFL